MPLNDSPLNSSSLNSESGFIPGFVIGEDDKAIFDHVSLALSRLTNEFADSTKLQALVRAIIFPSLDIESEMNDLRDKRWIDTAEGKQLDGVGFIVGELRQGRNDDDYRNAIKFRIFINTSQGTPQAIIYAAKQLTTPDDVQYLESYPACAMIFTDGANVPSGIQTTIQDVAPVGVETVPVMISYAEKPFRFTKEPLPNELFVNNKTDYLTANGAIIQVSNQFDTSEANETLGGVTPGQAFANGYFLSANGMNLVINNPEVNLFLDSGYHLTGVL